MKRYPCTASTPTGPCPNRVYKEGTTCGIHPKGEAIDLRYILARWDDRYNGQPDVGPMRSEEERLRR